MQCKKETVVVDSIRAKMHYLINGFLNEVSSSYKTDSETHVICFNIFYNKMDIVCVKSFI
jgi:hypothetical protein